MKKIRKVSDILEFYNKYKVFFAASYTLSTADFFKLIQPKDLQEANGAFDKVIELIVFHTKLSPQIPDYKTAKSMLIKTYIDGLKLFIEDNHPQLLEQFFAQNSKEFVNCFQKFASVWAKHAEHYIYSKNKSEYLETLIRDAEVKSGFKKSAILTQLEKQIGENVNLYNLVDTHISRALDKYHILSEAMVTTIFENVKKLYYFDVKNELMLFCGARSFDNKTTASILANDILIDGITQAIHQIDTTKLFSSDLIWSNYFNDKRLKKNCGFTSKIDYFTPQVLAIFEAALVAYKVPSMDNTNINNNNSPKV